MKIVDGPACAVPSSEWGPVAPGSYPFAVGRRAGEGVGRELRRRRKLSSRGENRPDVVEAILEGQQGSDPATASAISSRSSPSISGKTTIPLVTRHELRDHHRRR